MSLALTGDTVAYLMSLGLNADQMKGLIDRLQRDALAMAPPAAINGVNEERERLRNENTKAERKRAADRERQRLHREKLRVTTVTRDECDSPLGVTCDSHGDVTATREDVSQKPGDTAPSRVGAQVVTLTSSLRSEGTSEANASSVNASTPADPEKPKTKPPKSQRGTRLPDDWEPSEADVEVARGLGLTDEEISRAALEFRNYWCARSRDATKLSWPLTWHNRAIDVADRKRKHGERMASPSAQPGGSRRGVSSFADIYARRHGHVAD